MIGQSKSAGVLWLIAAVFGAAITIIFRIDPFQWVVTMTTGLAAAIVGVQLVSRPSAATFTLSNVAGMVWLVVYLALIILQRAELVAWGTDLFLGVLGVSAAALEYRTWHSPKHYIE